MERLSNWWWSRPLWFMNLCVFGALTLGAIVGGCLLTWFVAPLLSGPGL